MHEISDLLLQFASSLRLLLLTILLQRKQLEQKLKERRDSSFTPNTYFSTYFFIKHVLFCICFDEEGISPFLGLNCRDSWRLFGIWIENRIN